MNKLNDAKEHAILTDSTEVKCSRLVGYVSVANIIKWTLILLDGKTIYQSDNFIKCETWTLNLSSLNIAPGTQFHIKGVRLSKDRTNNTIITYTPDSNATAYFEATFSSLEYNGVVPPIYTPNGSPYLKCFKLTASNKSTTVIYYKLISLEGDELYVSKEYENGIRWTLDLKDTNIEPGTLFILKSYTPNTNRTAEVLFKYIPESIYEASFQIEGSASRSMIMYKGVIIEEKPESDLVTSTKVNCSRILCYQPYHYTVKWALHLLDGTILCESVEGSTDDSWIVYFQSLSISSATELYLTVTEGDYTLKSSQVFVYTPDSNATVYYEYNETLLYIGVVPLFYSPNSDPYLKCQRISIKNKTLYTSKYLLYSLDNQIIYESDFLEKGSTWTLDMSTGIFQVNSVFKVAAILPSGEQYVTDVLVQYVLNSPYVGTFELDGYMDRHILLYHGSYSLIPSGSSIVPVHQFMVYNDSDMIPKFSLELLDGTIVYTSESVVEWETLLISDDKINLFPGTLFMLKGTMPGRDIFMYKIYFEYQPSAGTAYCKLNGIAGSQNKELSYIDVLSPDATPPLLKCNKVKGLNESRMITKWSLLSNGMAVYVSGRYLRNKTWTLNLSDSDILPGKQFLLKAIAIAGEDSIGYVTLEYDPNSNTTAYFHFCGNAFNTVLIYEGTQ